MESRNFQICWITIGEVEPIPVDFSDSLSLICQKAPHSRVNNNRTLFGEPTEPLGVEDSVCYQTSYSLGFEYVYIKIGFTSSIEWYGM